MSGFLFSSEYETQRARQTRRIGSVPCGIILGMMTVVAPFAHGSETLPEKWLLKDRPEPMKGLEGNYPPSISLESWIGESVDISTAKNKVVVIDFWATWCGPCMAMIPKNIEIVDKYKDKGLVFVGVHDAKAGWDKASSVVADKRINYPVAKDTGDGDTTKAFHLAFWPTYVIIDKHGVVRGAGVNPQFLDDAISMLLEEDGPVIDGAENEDLLPSDWFYAGAHRPASLRQLEGAAMPRLDPTEWFAGSLTKEDAADRVVVLHFYASGNGPSMDQAKQLVELEKQLEPQGVLFVGVSPEDDDADKIRTALDEGVLPKRLCRDAAPKPIDESAGADPLANQFEIGEIASGFGVRYLPCTIVVDRAGIVRASGVRIDSINEIASMLLAESTNVTGQP